MWTPCSHYCLDSYFHLLSSLIGHKTAQLKLGGSKVDSLLHNAFLNGGSPLLMIVCFLVLETAHFHQVLTKAIIREIFLRPSGEACFVFRTSPSCIPSPLPFVA